MTPKDVARVTDYSEQTVLRVTRLWKQTGLNGTLQTGPAVLVSWTQLKCNRCRVPKWDTATGRWSIFELW